jgi:outer membrane receptor for ferrienterochelin and colicin
LFEHLSLTSRVAYSGWRAEQSNERNQLLHPELFLSWNRLRNNSLIAGCDYRYMNFERPAVLERDQQAIGMYIQDELMLNKVSLSGAIRMDKVENIPAVVSPKLAIMYRPFPFARIRATIGRGFHAPTVQELYEEGYGQGGRAYRFGNPDLQPEYSLTSTLSTDFLVTDKLQFFIYSYYNLIQDMITPVYRGPWEADSTIDIWVRTNINEAQIYGAEAYIKWNPYRALLLKSGYTYTHNKNMSTGSQLPYFPGQSYFAKITFSLDLTRTISVTGFINLKGVFDRSTWNWKPEENAPADSPDGYVTELGDYQLLNAGMRVGNMDRFEIFVNAHNLLRQDIETLDDLYNVFKGEVYYRTGINFFLTP